MARRTTLSETTVGTTWRLFRSFMFLVILLTVGYLLYSAGVAVSTANKCDGPIHANKEWNYIPPRWDCVSTGLPGEG